MLLRSSIASSHGFSFPKILCTSSPNPNKRNYSIPARDRVIDFGKHKGKMMGTLPSSYLRWVSKNLRAGDSLHWAHLADHVLQDPVYRDRIEWEFAEAVLNGDNSSNSKGVSGSISVSGNNSNNAVLDLLEISERFGWDNEDKDGWSRLNFELLGTSKGGRIPRLCNDNEDKVSLSPDGVSARVPTESGIRTKRLGPNSGSDSNDETADEEKSSEIISSRMRRIERIRLKLKREGDKKDKVQFFGGGESRTGASRMQSGSYSFMDGNNKVVSFRNEKEEEESRIENEPEVYNPFPGRESLLRKVLNRGRRLYRN